MLSAVIFNALVIVALIPLALRGVRYRPAGAAAMLRRNLLVYGLGGAVVASSSLGQNVTDPQWFQGRRSASEYAGNTTRSRVGQLAEMPCEVR